MKNEEEWIKNIRSRMENYSEPLPDGLWGHLEEELGHRKVIPLWRRWSVAAAVLVLVASSLTVGLLFVLPERNVSELQSVSEDALSAPLGYEKGVYFPQITDDLMTDASLPEMKKDVLDHALGVVSPEYAVVHLENPENLEEQDIESKEENHETSNKEEKEYEEQFAAKRERRLYSGENSAQRDGRHYQKKQIKGARQWEIGLVSGNTFYSSTNTLGGITRLDSRLIHFPDASAEAVSAANESALGRVLLNNRGRSVCTDIRHKMPVTVGVSLKWNMDDNWAFETGLNYTLLSSELHAGGDAYIEEEQKLHYVGIPLKVHRNIWKNRLFRVYASAGGMAEKCVSAVQEVVYADGNLGYEVGNVSLDIPEIQWSLLASVGAQVDFVRRIGLYIEPGIAYYFDDKSEVETIRKEHPFQFNLQLGLRFMLGR